jgi:hypothetical protein
LPVDTTRSAVPFSTAGTYGDADRVVVVQAVPTRLAVATVIALSPGLVAELPGSP